MKFKHSPKRGNGVSHPKHGKGIVVCSFGKDQSMVDFDGDDQSQVVDNKDLESLPQKAKSVKRAY